MKEKGKTTGKKKNNYRFKSFNEQIGEIKVGVRRVSNITQDVEEKTYMNEALQQWIELNCSEQYTDCHAKLSPLCQSLPQLLHHLPAILEILKEGLSVTGHGTEPLLDVVSHLALDLQQDFYPCLITLFPSLRQLLNAQEAELVTNVFKTFAHIFKTTWRTMLQNFEQTFQLLSVLLKAPTKGHVQRFAAESFAFLVRKHQNPDQLVLLLGNGVEEGLVAGVSALLFETIRGLQYKFNSAAPKYVPVLFKHALTSGPCFKQIFKNVLSQIVKHITKLETDFIWKLLLHRPTELTESADQSTLCTESADQSTLCTELTESADQSTLCTFIIFQLECVSIMLEGGRHTYLIEADTVCGVLSGIMEERFANEEICSLLTSSTLSFVSANNHLMRYLGQPSVCDAALLTKYFNSTQDVKQVAKLVDSLMRYQEFSERYLTIVNKMIVELFEQEGDHQLIEVLAKIAMFFETKDVLNKQTLFTIPPESRMGTFIVKEFVKIETELPEYFTESATYFWCLKIIQVLDRDLNINKFENHLAASTSVYYEFIKTDMGIDHTLDDTLALLEGAAGSVVLLQAYYQKLKKVQETDVVVPQFREVFDILKVNLMSCNSTRYLSLSILSLYPAVHYTYTTDSANVTMECRDVENALQAELTCLTLHTYRDKLMYCSNLRYSSEASPPAPYTEFRIRYLLGSLQWNLALVWGPLTQLIVDFAVNDSTTFWAVFSEVLEQASSTAVTEDPDDTPVSLHAAELLKYDCSKSEGIQSISDQNNFKLLLWKLMGEIPSIVEAKSRIVVPYFLDFMSDNFQSSYGFKMTDIALAKTSERTVKDKGVHLNDELRAYLKLLSQFVNPRALYKQDVLYQIYFSLLSNKQSDVQKLAYDCVASYKEECCMKYKDDLATLIDDVNFRDQLTKFDLTSADSIISEIDREELFPILLQILFGKMGSRMGHAKGKAGSKLRQGVVLRWLQGARETELKQFLDLINKQFGVNQLSDTPSYSIIPLGMQTAFLNIVKQTLATLPSAQMEPFALSLTTTLLSMTSSTRHCLDNRTLIQSHTLTPLKALRQLTLKALHKLFTVFTELSFADVKQAVIDQVVVPLVPTLASESLQTCSPLLLLIECWSSTRAAWLQTQVHGKALLSYVFTLLTGKGVADKVVTSVLNIVFNLLDNADIGTSLLAPHISCLVQHIYTSITRLCTAEKKVKEKKPKLSAQQKAVQKGLEKAVKGAKPVASGTGKTLKLELQLLARLSTSVTDPSLCRSLITSLLHSLDRGLLWKSQDVVHSLQSICDLMDSAVKVPEVMEVDAGEETTSTDIEPVTPVETLVTMETDETANVKPIQEDKEAGSVTTDTIKAAPSLIDYNILYRLLGSVKDNKSRAALCLLLQRVGHPAAEVLVKLQAMNTSVIDEPDFDLRLEGYREAVVLLAELATFTGVSFSKQDLVLPLLYTSCYTVMSSDEMALRDSASHSTMRLLDCVHTVPALYHVTVEECVVGFIKKGLKNKSEVFRNEATILLQHIVKVFTEQPRWGPLASLADYTDPEVDFFENIRHIQPHRRTRAIARLKVSIPTLPATVLWDLILPLLHPLFSLNNNKYHNTVEEALLTLTDICRRFKWVKYHKLLKRYLQMLATDIENKVMVKVIGAVLAGFHEPVVEEGKVLNIITKEVLPKLLGYLTKETAPPQGHKKSLSYEGDQVAIQAPIAIAAVSLIQQLPESYRAASLPPVLIRITNTLKNRSMDVRNTTRQTLASIAKELGPKYFGYIVNEMRSTLNKGYMLHVLAYTLHHLLQELNLQSTELDNGTLGMLMEVFIDGVSGATAQDRDRGEKKNSLPEAKKSYSPVCIEICCSVAAVSQIQCVLGPVKQMVQSSTHSKMKSRCEEVLRCMVNGLLRNPLVTPTVAMVMCHEMLSDEALHGERKRKAKPVDNKVTIYDLPKPVKRGGAAPTPTPKSNTHLLQEFALQIVSTLLKRNVLTTKNCDHVALLDPFVVTVTRCLESPAVKTQVLALRCLSLLFEEPHLLPSLCQTVSSLSAFAFEVLRNHTKSTNSGLMLELIFSSFKILTTILREYSDFEMSELQIKALVQYVTEDIYNRNRQATAFSLLRAILSRNIALPEIVELLESIAELSVTGQTDFVRTQCRQVFIQYLLNYPLGKKLQQYITFITKQLEYTHKDGRMSALELVTMVTDKLPKHILKNYTAYIFICLSTCIINDESTECRKAASLALSALVKGAGEDMQNKLLNLTLDWFKDKKMSHRYLAVQLIEIFTKIEGYPVKRLERAMEPLAHLIKTLSSVEEDVEMTTTRDQVLYLAVMVVIQLGKTHPIPSLVYERLGQLQGHSHQWIRLAGSQLLGHLLSLETNVLCQPSQDYFQKDTRDKLAVITEQTLAQLKSPNLLPAHVDQIAKNIVYLTRALLEGGETEENASGETLSVSDIIHKMTVLAAVEASQSPKTTTKRCLVMKWVAALCTSSTEPSLLHPFLPSFLQTLQREMKSSIAPEELSMLATEIMQLLRERFGKEEIASALLAADKTLVEKKRKRKREAALQAIADPEKSAKRKVKVNLSKRVKRKEKYKVLKSKQFQS